MSDLLHAAFPDRDPQTASDGALFVGTLVAESPDAPAVAVFVAAAAAAVLDAGVDFPTAAVLVRRVRDLYLQLLSSDGVADEEASEQIGADFVDLLTQAVQDQPGDVDPHTVLERVLPRYTFVLEAYQPPAAA